MIMMMLMMMMTTMMMMMMMMMIMMMMMTADDDDDYDDYDDDDVCVCVYVKTVRQSLPVFTCIQCRYRVIATVTTNYSKAFSI